MKKIALLFITLFTLNTVSAQSFDLSMLDKAMTLVNKGNATEASSILTKAVEGISKETKSSATTAFTTKITSQLGTLASLATSGNTSKLQKAINTVKTLVAANRLKNMLGGSLLDKGAQVSSNTKLLSTGLSLLGGGNTASQASSLLNLVSKNASKLDQGGTAAKAAEKVVSQNLGSSLKLIEGLF